MYLQNRRKTVYLLAMNEKNPFASDKDELMRWLEAEMEKGRRQNEQQSAEPTGRPSIRQYLKRTNMFNVRQGYGLTQIELAAKVGTTQHAISAIENGRREPSVYLALAVSQVLEVPLQEIFMLQRPTDEIDMRRWAVVQDRHRGG